MKTFILFLMILTVSALTFGQDTHSAPERAKADYLQISRSQKTGAFILLGLGAAGIAIAAPGHVSFDILPVLAIGSAAAIAGSITLFVASVRNKRKVDKLSAYFKIEKIPVVGQGGFTCQSYPAFSLKINMR